MVETTGPDDCGGMTTGWFAAHGSGFGLAASDDATVTGPFAAGGKPVTGSAAAVATVPGVTSATEPVSVSAAVKVGVIGFSGEKVTTAGDTVTVLFSKGSSVGIRGLLLLPGVLGFNGSIVWAECVK